MSAATCPIWGTPAERLASPITGGGDFSVYDSRRAGGVFALTGSVMREGLGRLSPSAKARLTTWIVEQHKAGEERPIIKVEVLRDVRVRPALPVAIRRDRALNFLGDRGGLGTSIRFAGVVDEDVRRNVDELLAATDSAEASEARALLQFLKQGELITIAGSLEVTLTFAGWQAIEGLRAQSARSLQAFVAMWFDPSMAEPYSAGIDPAIREAGYVPMRIDGKEHVNKIDDEIIAEIRRSRFLVVDFTSEPGKPRGGVYFEAGFAFGLGIPVIWMCHQDRINEIHFDTRQYNHITWSSPAEIRAKLRHRIGAVIGDGPQPG